MYSHRNSGGRVFLIDDENKLIGTSSDGGTTLKGFLLDTVLTEKLTFNDGTSVSKTGVNIYLSDNEELDMNGVQVDGSSFLSSLFPLTSCALEIVGTPSSTEIVVDVKSVLDNVPVSGLVVGDFVLNDAQTIDTAVEDSNVAGRYTLSGTGLVTGTLQLVAPSLLSIPQPFESESAVTVTIA